MDEEEKEEQVLEKPPSSYLASLMNHVKCTIGSGIFTLGFHFRNAGMALGPPLLICIALIQLHCQHLLVQSAKMVQEASPDSKIRPDLGETGKGCFLYGPEKLRNHSSTAKTLSNTILIITQIGVCCIYITFFAESMKRVADIYDFELNIRFWILIGFLPVWITSCCLINLKWLGFLSALGNILMFSGIFIAVYLTADDIPEETSFKWIGNLLHLPMFIATCVFAFTNIMVVLPIYIEIKDNTKVDSWFGVLNAGTLIEIIFTVMVGILSYWAFGDNCKGSITLNYQDTAIGQTVVILVGLSILLSYALNMYVATESVFPVIMKKWGPFSHPLLKRFFFQTAAIIGTFVFALSIPILEDVVGFFGALGNVSLSVFVPAFFHFVISYDTASKWILTKDFLIMIFGLMAVTFGLISACINIYKDLKKE